MDFLKEILGEELFSAVAEKINAHNGNEANKDKQIKIGNLGNGEYTSKSKYDALNELLKGKETELQSANDLIAELKKGTKGNEELQAKIAEYDSTVQQLKKELQETKIKSAVKVGLLAEHCSDVDYTTYKLMESLKEKGETLELDENDAIKGWDDKLSGLKTQLPTFFGSGSGDDGEYKPLGNNGLPKDTGNKSITKEQFMKMTVDERIALKQKDENLYKTLRG